MVFRAMASASTCRRNGAVCGVSREISNGGRGSRGSGCKTPSHPWQTIPRRAGIVGTSFYEPLPVGLRDLIEDPAVIQMRFFSLLPVPNHLSERAELPAPELVLI